LKSLESFKGLEGLNWKIIKFKQNKKVIVFQIDCN